MGPRTGSSQEGSERRARVIMNRPSTLAFSCTTTAGALRLPNRLPEGPTSIRLLAVMSATTLPATTTLGASIGPITVALGATVIVSVPKI